MGMSRGVYILLLKGSKYYVGYSEDMEGRIAKHFDGKGSKWTQKYRPIKVLSKESGATVKDEQKITRALMAVIGSDKVRGGGYTSRGKINPQLGGGCQASTALGKPCKAPPITGSRYCMFHRSE
jgi:putative endonuclease